MVLVRETKTGKYKQGDSDGNTYRSFRPKSGFKRDHREGQMAPRRQVDGEKHIDLKALRKDRDPLRSDKGKRPFDKKPFGKRFDKKGGRFGNRQKKQNDGKKDSKEDLDRQME